MHQVSVFVLLLLTAKQFHFGSIQFVAIFSIEITQKTTSLAIDLKIFRIDNEINWHSSLFYNCQSERQLCCCWCCYNVPIGSINQSSHTLIFCLSMHCINLDYSSRQFIASISFICKFYIIRYVNPISMETFFRYIQFDAS